MRCICSATEAANIRVVYSCRSRLAGVQCCVYTHTHAAKGHAKAHWAWPNGMAKCANGMALVLGRDLETLEQTSYGTRVIRFKLIPPDSPMRGFFFQIWVLQYQNILSRFGQFTPILTTWANLVQEHVRFAKLQALKTFEKNYTSSVSW
jgi:hypothetical protein